MATSQTTEAKAANPKDHLIGGKICVFNLGSEIPERKWFTMDTTYGIARKVFKVEPYNPTMNKGVQRPRIDSHVRALKKATKAGEYTPAPWSAHLLDSHVKNMEVNANTGYVKLNVNERVPLCLTDGGHRRETLEDLRNDAIKAGDKATVSLIDSLGITVIIYLDPKFMRRDFRHLQEGLKVNKSQTKFMEQADGDVDPKRKPFITIARKAALALNASPDSFLHNQVKFASGELAAVEYATITAPGGSDMATSLYGGARIVWAQDRFRPLIPDEEAAFKFLVECQNAAWLAIHKFGEKVSQTIEADGTTTEVPAVLMLQRILRPTKMKGPKAGTSLLIMLGNMLAYRMLAFEKKIEITPKNQKDLVKSITNVLDIEMYGGGSGTVKREVTGRFVRDYFEDVVRSPKEQDKKRVDAVDGVPIELANVILTRSTLDVDKNAREYLAGDGKHKRTAEQQTDPTWTDDDNATSTAEGESEDDTIPELAPDFSEAEDEEFVPPPGRDAKPVQVSPKNNKAITGMG